MNKKNKQEVKDLQEKVDTQDVIPQQSNIETLPENAIERLYKAYGLDKEGKPL